MRRLVALAVLAALLGGLAALDVAARSYVERRIEERARAEARDVAAVAAEISSFPFLGRLLVAGAAGDLDLRLRELVTPGLTLATLDVELDDVRVDRERLLSERRVRIVGIGSGRATLGLGANELSRAVGGLPVTVAGGRVRVSLRGQTVDATPEVTRDGELRLRVGGLPALNVPAVRTGLVPCTVTDVSVRGDRVLLSCAITDVPPALRTAGAGA